MKPSAVPHRSSSASRVPATSLAVLEETSSPSCFQTPPRDVETIAQRLIIGLQDTAGLSASVGITLNPTPTSSQSHLDIVEAADHALRVAKHTGKRGVRIADAA